MKLTLNAFQFQPRRSQAQQPRRQPRPLAALATTMATIQVHAAEMATAEETMISIAR